MCIRDRQWSVPKILAVLFLCPDRLVCHEPIRVLLIPDCLAVSSSGVTPQLVPRADVCLAAVTTYYNLLNTFS